MTIQRVSVRARCPIKRIEELNSRKRQNLARGVYGLGLIGAAVLLMLLDPVRTFTEWFLRMEEGSFMFRMWQEPPYQLYSNVYVFNYTNVPEFISGKESKLRVEEIGPFIFQEKRVNHNMSVDRTRGVLTMVPNTSLTFLRERSVADTKDLRVIVPNLALIALSTLATDTLPWWSNRLVGTLIRGLGSQLFLNLTVHEYLWGYRDPLVSIAGTVAPGWIDFGDIGILDRFYDQKPAKMEVELKNDKGNMYSIISWDGSAGLKEQGYQDFNSSIPCNRIKGSYEGLMLSPGLSRDTNLRLFRKQACRVYPFEFDHEALMDIGVTYYRYTLEKSSFNSTSPFACKCIGKCLPDGFIDISKCFYNFPVSLSKPHLMDADPGEVARYEGLRPRLDAHSSFMDFEPTLSVPVKLRSTVQANIAVRTSPYNTITRPVDRHILPMMWLSMYANTVPENIALLLKLRVTYGPPAAVALEIVLLLLGCWLLATGIARHFPLKSLGGEDGERRRAAREEKTEAEILL